MLGILAALEPFPSFKVFLAIFIAAALTMVLLPVWIRLLRIRQIGQQVRADGPERHYVKQGTPTMGGVVILFAIMATALLLGDMKSTPQVFALILIAVATALAGVMGLIDDLSKVVKERSLGLRPNAKILCQTLISVGVCEGAVTFGGSGPVGGLRCLPPRGLGGLRTVRPW
ncbi:MAG: hypothetical protein LBU48_04770, partial [Coriobacteriales bacterium]|nr:hypothetical protein [Coriobacteriales bacterium]